MPDSPPTTERSIFVVVDWTEPQVCNIDSVWESLEDAERRTGELGEHSEVQTFWLNKPDGYEVGE